MASLASPSIPLRGPALNSVARQSPGPHGPVVAPQAFEHTFERAGTDLNFWLGLGGNSVGAEQGLGAWPGWTRNIARLGKRTDVVEGLYGAIDLAGTLRVPLEYNQLNAFQTRYAAAIRAGGGGSGLVLISQNNKLIKELGAYTSLEVPDNGNEARYYVRDPNDSDAYLVYDADGNLVQKDE